jgi:hypothetical protein
MQIPRFRLRRNDGFGWHREFDFRTARLPMQRLGLPGAEIAFEQYKFALD